MPSPIPPRDEWPPHLFLRGKRFYARLRVPDSVARTGTHLQQSLRTDRYAEALKRLPVVVSALRLQLEGMRRARPVSERRPLSAVEREAEWWRDQIARAGGNPDSGNVPKTLDDQWSQVIENKLGDVVGEQPDERGRPEPIYEGEGEVRRLVDLVFGRVLPVEANVERFIAERELKPRYADRHRRATRRLRAWMITKLDTDDLRRVTRKLAGEFYDNLLVEQGVSTPTANSLVGTLAVYWRWLGDRLGVEGNPWVRQTRKAKAIEALAAKRPFTDAELVALLNGDTYLTIHDLMRIAALSGMRIDEIARLTVAGTSNGMFRVLQGKTANAIREVPIHPGLTLLVARRSEGKADSERLFDELRAPASGSRELSSKASERFTAYRRRMGVDERQEGQRQSNVDFHSFRRWFATKAEQAGHPPHLISAVTGHSDGRESMALSLYSSGPSVAQKLAVVSSVLLPLGARPDSPPGPLLGSGHRSAL